MIAQAHWQFLAITEDLFKSYLLEKTENKLSVFLQGPRGKTIIYWAATKLEDQGPRHSGVKAEVQVEENNNNKQFNLYDNNIVTTALNYNMDTCSSAKTLFLEEF